VGFFEFFSEIRSAIMGFLLPKSVINQDGCPSLRRRSRSQIL